MSRPWQVATIYLLCVVLALAAMAAVTSNGLQLDRAEQESRLRAELEERVGGALWTMDAEVSSLLAEELARPAREFSCPKDLPPGIKGKTKGAVESLEPEPPLPTASEDPLVLLRFRVDIDNRWESPQAEAVGAKASVTSALGEIRSAVDFRQLALTLPLPDDVRGRLQLADSGTSLPQGVVNNAYAPQSRSLRNESRRQQFGPNTDGLAQQPQVYLPPQQTAGQQIEDGANALFQGRQAQRGVSQTIARNTLIVRRLEAVQAILSAERNGEERWSNTLWIGDYLVLARLTIENDVAMILGVCLDWERLQNRLKDRVGDALDPFQLQPIADENEILKNRVLATLPVRVVTPPISAADFDVWTPIRVTLGLAWLFLSLAAFAVGALLIGAVQLSERRASFVAAVTHELRSPLTTFQLYTEMLLGGMVREDDRTTYLKTLKAESERLAHLVENVLQYSRLERGKHPRRDQETTADEMMERFAPRLDERLRQAGMRLKVQDDSQGAAIRTDAGAVEQILYNLADNAGKYASNGKPPLLQLRWHVVRGRLICEARDFGPGISAAGRRQLFHAFSKSVHEAAETAPGVGLGLALCQRLAQQLGGRLELRDLPADEAGACFTLDLGPISPPQRPAAG